MYDDLGRVSDRVASDFALPDRRGGGRLGFSFSSSCCSGAETKDEAEDAFSLLSIEFVTRAWNDVERVKS